MPDENPKPTWRKIAEVVLPSNWRQIVQWLVLIGMLSLFNWATGRKGPDALPIPEPPIPLFLVVPDGTELDPATLEDLKARGVNIRFTGWHPPTPEEQEATARVLQIAKFSDTDAGRMIVGDADAPLWRLANKGRGKGIPVRDQGQVGSCVSFGFAAAVEYTMAAQNSIGKQRQELPDICQEAIYAGSRVEVNGGRVPFNGDGSTGAWGAKWLETTGGALARGVYGSHDLSAYDQSRCKQWGSKGVPDDLEPLARKHKADCALVASAAEAKSALSQGYAISVCSNQGFDSNKDAQGRCTRDADGFLAARGSWGHCMCIIGYRADKPGFLILNSWGPNWVKGPKGKFDDIPDGSFWATEAVVERMLKQQDSYAVANAEGFRRRKLSPDDWAP